MAGGGVKRACWQALGWGSVHVCACRRWGGRGLQHQSLQTTVIMPVSSIGSALCKRLFKYRGDAAGQRPSPLWRSPVSNLVAATPSSRLPMPSGRGECGMGNGMGMDLGDEEASSAPADQGLPLRLPASTTAGRKPEGLASPLPLRPLRPPLLKRP